MPTLFSRVQLLKITRLILPFLLFLCACGHESANRKAGAAITLAQVQNPAGCLNAKLYFDLFQAMDGNVPIRLMTTGFSTNTAVQNDLLLLAYRSFQFEELPRSNVTEFFPVDQKDCDSLSYGPNGESVFKVQSASKEKYRT